MGHLLWTRCLLHFLSHWLGHLCLSPGATPLSFCSHFPSLNLPFFRWKVQIRGAPRLNKGLSQCNDLAAAFGSENFPVWPDHPLPEDGAVHLLEHSTPDPEELWGTHSLRTWPSASECLGLKLHTTPRAQPEAGDRRWALCARQRPAQLLHLGAEVYFLSWELLPCWDFLFRTGLVWWMGQGKHFPPWVWLAWSVTPAAALQTHFFHDVIAEDACPSPS